MRAAFQTPSGNVHLRSWLAPWCLRWGSCLDLRNRGAAGAIATRHAAAASKPRPTRRQVSQTRLDAAAPWGGGGTVGDALLAPTALYVRRLLALIGADGVDVRVRIGPGAPACRAAQVRSS